MNIQKKNSPQITAYPKNSTILFVYKSSLALKHSVNLNQCESNLNSTPLTGNYYDVAFSTVTSQLWVCKTFIFKSLGLVVISI